MAVEPVEELAEDFQIYRVSDSDSKEYKEDYEQVLTSYQSSPNKIHQGSFELDYKSAEPLAKACAALLASLPLPALQAYRLELRPSGDGMWNLEIKFDPVVWFDEYLRGKDYAITIARAYVEDQRREAYAQRESTDFTLPTVEPPEYCFYVECGCHKKHSLIRCKQLVSRRGGAHQRECGWFLTNELLLWYDDFVLLCARTELQRDLLLLPNPVVPETPHQNWSQHYTNHEVVRLPFFWKKVIQMCKLLTKCNSEEEISSTVEMIALNFGLWETAMSHDKRAIDCHAHAHIHLTKTAVDTFAKHSDFNDIMVGRTNPPENYKELNCHNLESKRLFALELKSLSDNMKETKQVILEAMNEKFNLLAQMIQGLQSSK